MISSLDPMPPEEREEPNCQNDSDRCEPRMILECNEPLSWCDFHQTETRFSFAREIPYNFHLGRMLG